MKIYAVIDKKGNQYVISVWYDYEESDREDSLWEKICVDKIWLTFD